MELMTGDFIVLSGLKFPGIVLKGEETLTYIPKKEYKEIKRHGSNSYS